jgi:hypothetical protein
MQKSGGGGNRTPHLPSFQKCISETQVALIPAKTRNIGVLPASTSVGAMQRATSPEQFSNKSVHPNCATCVQANRQDLPDDLIRVIDAWSSLQGPIRAGILAIVNAAPKP